MLVAEREKKLRYLQNFAGTKPLAYYLSMWIGDYLIFFCIVLSQILFMLIFGLKAFVNQIGAIFLSFLIYGIAFIPFNYLVSFLFDREQTCVKVFFIPLLIAEALTLVFEALSDGDDTAVLLILKILFPFSH